MTTTTVTVRYFAAAAEAAACEEEQLDVEGEPTIGGLRRTLEQRYGAPMARVLASGSFLVDRQVRTDPAVRLTGTVDVLPPFAGG